VIADGAPRDNLITDCPLFTASAELMALWENWKDHLFYAVADAYQPLANPNPTPVCGLGLRCITINEGYPNPGDRDYAAVVIFSGTMINAQGRDAPPIDADVRFTLSNYLENANDNIPIYTDTAGDDTRRYDHQAPDNTFNDIVYCINDDDGGATLEVSLCPTNTS